MALLFGSRGEVRAGGTHPTLLEEPGGFRGEWHRLGTGSAFEFVLLYDARQATKDVDAFAVGSTDPATLRKAAERVASALGLPENWLNDGAKGYLNGVLPGKVLLDRPALLIRALAPQQLLAMKLSAWRDDVYIADARVLLREFPGERAEIWSLVQPLTTFGNPSMDLDDLVHALLRFDALSARQWLADAARAGLVWSEVPAPLDLDQTECALAAGVVELMAARAGQPPPTWAADIPAAPKPLFLVRSAATMPRLRATREREGPEPLRRRGLLAPPDFLTIA